MPSEEKIPVMRRGERVDGKKPQERAPKVSVTDKGIELNAPVLPRRKPPKVVPIKTGVVSG